MNLILMRKYSVTDSLRNKFKNIKTRSKKKFAEHKRHLYGTGGGPHKPYEETEVDEKVREIIGQQRLEGLDGEYDDDFINNEIEVSGDEHVEKLSFPDDVILDNLDLERVVVVIDDGAQSTVSVEKGDNLVNDWSSYNPAMLRTKVSSPLRTYCVSEQDNLQLGMQVADHDYSLMYAANNPSSSKSESVQLSPSTPTSILSTPPSKALNVNRILKRKHQLTGVTHFSVVGDHYNNPGPSSKNDNVKLLKKCDSERNTAPTKRISSKSCATSSSPPRVKNLAVLRGKMGKWATTKIELANLQKQCFLEEHKRKLLHMDKKHEQTMALEKEEFELKKQIMMEEHRAKMANLSSKTPNN